MSGLSWQKQQDFCLRLGLLKAFVALIGVSRGSSDRSAVLRRADSVIFPALDAFPDVLGQVTEMLGDAPPHRIDSLASGLLLLSGSASWGQPIRRKTSYKLLDWSQAMRLVGRGNRATEQGVLLHSLFPLAAQGRLTSESMIAWNPFNISPVEVAFLLHHLLEIDALTGRVLVAAGLRGAGFVFDADAARRLTSEQLDEMVQRADSRAAVSDLGSLRVLKELAATIRWEVGRGERPRTPQPPRPRPIPGSRKATKSGPGSKNADHQTIPRFEQLCDLGFFTKEIPTRLRGSSLVRARNAWSFEVTPSAEAFANAVGTPERVSDRDWLAGHFAGALGKTGLFGPTHPADPRSMVSVLAEAYGLVGRRTGHTPFHSIALVAMILGLGRGARIEMSMLHELFLKIKSGRGLGDHVSFAAGNELDRMFVSLDADFDVELEEWILADSRRFPGLEEGLPP